MKWTSSSFVSSSAEAILSFTSTILALMELRQCVVIIFRSFISFWDMSSESPSAKHCATSWPAELSSRRTARICPKHTHNQPRVNTHNTCTHLCVSNCRFNVPSPAQEHTARDAITTSQTNKKKHQKQDIYRDPRLLFTRWSWLELNESVGWAIASCCNKAPPLEDRKGLQALTALIGSIMKLHGTYLMVTTGDILFVWTEMLHMTPGRSYRV